MVLELYYHTKAAIPDYATLDPLSLHIAFTSADVVYTANAVDPEGEAAEGEETRMTGIATAPIAKAALTRLGGSFRGNLIVPRRPS